MMIMNGLVSLIKQLKMKKVLFGIDQLLTKKNKLQQLRLALVTNNAATTFKGEPGRVALINKGFNITKLFSPEHGLTAQGEDGAYQNNSADTITKLPVISLYGEQLMPTEEDLTDVDAVLFDIPDAGCRFYTYLWTMTYVMEVCAAYKKPLIILDRPNPISGNLNLAEGPMLDEEHCHSFIGRWNIPVRHCCTLGELAKYFAATRVKDLDLELIEVQNWNREKTVTETSWFFAPPSPAICDFETAILYPGMGLLEGINVNEGRGTKNPFKIMGSPWINATQLQKEFHSLHLPGLLTSVHSYTAAGGLYAGKACHGLQFNISDPFSFCPVQSGLRLIQLIASLHPEHCEERLYVSRANPSGTGHLDKLTGVYHSFEKIKRNELLATKVATTKWKEIIQSYLTY